MEKQELLNAFAKLQDRVETVSAVQAALLGHVKTAQTETTRSRVRWSPIWDIIIASITLMLIGNFAADHFAALRAAPVTALPGVFTAICALVFLNLGIRQLILISELDYAKPILETQNRLEQLRKLRVGSIRWGFIFGFPAWLVVPLLFIQMFAGPLVLLKFNIPWVIGNFALGVLMIPVVNWIMLRSKYAMSIQDAFVGKEILEAEKFLVEMREFASE